ncbi:glycosyltransferase [Microbacterium sp. 179-B 1A2 NHS]|uniref:glycosyltransferase family 2 protein n=1 Tax=Microbacterium sp. 179-B 1A2 NHS TaxID=3142383 RepID=UPI0039A25E26
MRATAIIPTIGRPELRRAVESVTQQSVQVDVLVTLDRPEKGAEVRAMLHDYPHRLVLTSGNIGGGAARNLGVARSATEVVAFLDDDDVWAPTKTEAQLEQLTAKPDSVIATRAWLQSEASARLVPERPFDNSASIVDYLLDRSTMRLRRNFIQSSSLMMTRSTAIKVPWRADLSRHQDWTLLIDLARAGHEIVTMRDPLVYVHQGSNGSISRSTNWSASEEWLDHLEVPISRRSAGDFLCSVAVRSALAAGDLKNATRLLRRGLRYGPHPAAVLVGLSSIPALVSRRRSIRSAGKASSSV